MACIHIYLFMCQLHAGSVMSMMAKERHQMLWNWRSYCCELPWDCWEPNLGPLQSRKCSWRKGSKGLQFYCKILLISQLKISKSLFVILSLQNRLRTRSFGPFSLLVSSQFKMLSSLTSGIPLGLQLGFAHSGLSSLCRFRFFVENRLSLYTINTPFPVKTPLSLAIQRILALVLCHFVGQVLTTSCRKSLQS